MTRLLVIVVSAAIFAIPTIAPADKVVRDRYGNLVETWHDSNGSTEIRDRYGSLKETRTYRNGSVDVRDRNGSLIGTEQGSHRGR
jgi:hypothetical protein